MARRNQDTRAEDMQEMLPVNDSPDDPNTQNELSEPVVETTLNLQAEQADTEPVPQDPEQAERIKEFTEEFVTRKEAYDVLGLRATNTTKALDTLAEYEIFGRTVYVKSDVEALAANRADRTNQRLQGRAEKLSKARERAAKAQERAQKAQDQLLKLTGTTQPAVPGEIHQPEAVETNDGYYEPSNVVPSIHGAVNTTQEDGS